MQSVFKISDLLLGVWSQAAITSLGCEASPPRPAALCCCKHTLCYYPSRSWSPCFTAEDQGGVMVPIKSALLSLVLNDGPSTEYNYLTFTWEHWWRHNAAATPAMLLQHWSTVLSRDVVRRCEDYMEPSVKNCSIKEPRLERLSFKLTVVWMVG